MLIRKLSLPLFVTAVLIAGPLASAQSVTSTTSTTTTSGLVSEMAPDALVIRTQSSAVPIRYLSSSSTVFVDETGAPVAREVVASGLPVTVDYIRDGERMIASRVVVHRRTTTTAPGTTTTTTTPGTPAVIEKTTTVNPPPVVVEKRVEVPVEKKVYVDRPVDRPVIVEKKVPVDRPVIVEKKVLVDRPVIVEKPVPAPAVEEKRTTTTTTTTKAKKDRDDD